MENNKEQIELSKILATITTDVPVEFDATKFQKEEPDKEQLKELFSELEFKTIAKRYFDESENKETKTEPVQTSLFDGPASEIIPTGTLPNNITNTQHKYTIADTQDKIQDIIGYLGPVSYTHLRAHET